MTNNGRINLNLCEYLKIVAAYDNKMLRVSAKIAISKRPFRNLNWILPAKTYRSVNFRRISLQKVMLLNEGRPFSKNIK